MSTMRFLLFAIFFSLNSVAYAATTVENVRIWSENDKTRVVLDLSKSVTHKIFTLRDPDRIVIDLKDSRLGGSLKSLPQGTGAVRGIRSAIRANGQLRVVLDLAQPVRSRSFTAGPNSSYGDRLVVDLHRAGNLQAVKRASEAYRPGRDIIVAIDAGHGGKDPGSVGRRTKEKDIVLSISRELARRVNEEPGMRAVMVRDSDRYIGLNERVDIARKNEADLLVSIHADGYRDSRASGASVWALDLDRANREARAALSKRNQHQVKVGDVSLNDKDPVLASVLYDLSQSAALSASNDVGMRVSRQMSRVAKMHSKKVRAKSLAVLTSAEMPSILVETGFMTNPSEETKLRDLKHQNRLASAILAGIRDYFYDNAPADTRIAMELKKQPAKQVRHVIARGDTISEIAERYNVSVASIRRANRLASDNIKVGQTLSIPVFSGG